MRLFSKIAIISWTVYFLLSITGISLQRLYCHCADMEWVSIFEIEKKCEAHKIEKKELKSCCAKLLGCEKPEVEESHDDNCCDPKTEYIKADIDLVSVSIGVELPSFYSSTAIYTYSNPFLKNNSILEMPDYHPPPERYGDELRDFVQSYLC